MPNLASLGCIDIGQSSGRGISELWTSGEPLIKENFHNFGTSDDTNMKLGPINKIKKRKDSIKNIDDDVTSATCDVIILFTTFC